MRTRFLLALALLGLAAPSLAGDYDGVTNKRANLRPGMGDGDPIAIIPAGTQVAVDICFSQGAFCAVQWNGQQGFVSGDLLNVMVDCKPVTAKQAEAAKWQAFESDAKPVPAASSPDVAAWGDSLTAGAGADRGYPAMASALFNPARKVTNEGVGGQSSTAIAARMNAVPTQLALAGGAVPASGSVTVTEQSVTPLSNGMMSQQGAICGVDGVLSATTSDNITYSYTFTRTTPGPALPCPTHCTFEFADAKALRNDVAWLWLGRNGPDKGHTVEDDIAAAISSLGHDRYLVGSVLPSAADDDSGLAGINRLNAALKAKYPSHYVDVFGALVAAADGSADDATDTAAGRVPRSLRSDVLHLNAKGYAVVAKAFHDTTEANGY